MAGTHFPTRLHVSGEPLGLHSPHPTIIALRVPNIYSRCRQLGSLFEIQSTRILLFRCFALGLETIYSLSFYRICLLSLYRSYTMSARRMKVGCAGLGRMGKRHALNFLERTPRAELVAASSPDPAELEWAKTHLEPFGVRLYQNYDDMLKQEGLEAVVVASATAVHAEQAIKAINADKHVLCEKPLSTSAEVVSLHN